MENERTPANWTWSYTIPIFRAYEENGNWVLEGLGGDAAPDDYSTRLSVSCIADMKKQVADKSVPLLRSHWDEEGKGIRRAKWYDEMGTVEDMSITPSGQFFPKIILDKSDTYAQKLFSAVMRGKRFGMSYGGGELAFHLETDGAGRSIRVFDKLDLWHFVPTTEPVNRRTLNSPLSVIARSLNWTSAEERKVESHDMTGAFQDQERVAAIYREVKERKQSQQEPATNVSPSPKESEEIFRSWFQKHGVQSETELDNGDFAWISSDGKVRKLPYKVRGKVYEDGWRAAWNAVHGARSAMDFSGGPSKEETIRKLLRDKPGDVQVSRSKDDPDNSFTVDGIFVARSADPDAYAICNDILTKGDSVMLSTEDIKALGDTIGAQFRTAIEGMRGDLVSGVKEVMRETKPADVAPPATTPEPAPATVPAPAAPATAPAVDMEEITRSLKTMVADALKAIVPDAKALLKGGVSDTGGNPDDEIMRETKEVLTGKKLRSDVTNKEVLRAVDTICRSAALGQAEVTADIFRSIQ